MIDLKKAPPELFAQALESNLQGIGPLRKLVGHFAEAVMMRLGAQCAWVVEENGEMMTLRGNPDLCDRARTLIFLNGGRPAPDPGVVLARVTAFGRKVAVVGAARRHGTFGQGARRTLDRLCGVLAEELVRREEQRL